MSTIVDKTKGMEENVSKNLDDLIGATGAVDGPDGRQQQPSSLNRFVVNKV